MPQNLPAANTALCNLPADIIYPRNPLAPPRNLPAQIHLSPCLASRATMQQHLQCPIHRGHERTKDRKGHKGQPAGLRKGQTLADLVATNCLHLLSPRSHLSIRATCHQGSNRAGTTGSLDSDSPANRAGLQAPINTQLLLHTQVCILLSPKYY